MASTLFRRVGSKLAVVSFSAGVGAAGALIASSDDPHAAFRICKSVPLRLIRDAVTVASIAFDYEYSLLGLVEGTLERSRVKHEVHLRSAHKLQELCFRNGGIYIKFGQHIGQLEYLVPLEYVKTMRESMLNKCPVSSYEQVCEVFMRELGCKPEEMFYEFDPVPIASASLAQVHAARTHDGHKVAVKVQHARMIDTEAIDYATVDLLVRTLHRLFPAFDYRWLVDEMKESLPKELDFLVEAKNSERCSRNFRQLSPLIAQCVHVPKVYWSLSTPRLLTMEFIDAPHVGDVESIERLGIRPCDVANLVSRAFSEMIFRHGFVHCDPHAANLLVRPLPRGRMFLPGRRPQLVLLDHGLYKELDVTTRRNYAALWKALVLADGKSVKECSATFGAGDHLYPLFAGVLTMRPWDRVIDPSIDHLVVRGGDSDQLQMYASQYFAQITDLLSRLPRVILLMMKTNDCLRAVHASLRQGHSFESFVIIGRTSSEVVMEMKMERARTFVSRVRVRIESLYLHARFFLMRVAVWLAHFTNP